MTETDRVGGSKGRGWNDGKGEGGRKEKKRVGGDIKRRKGSDEGEGRSSAVIGIGACRWRSSLASVIDSSKVPQSLK